MKRLVCVLLVMAIVTGMVGTAFAEGRIGITKNACVETLKILKQICAEYDRAGKLDDERVYLAGLYFGLYFQSYRIYVIESLVDSGESIELAVETIKLGNEMSYLFNYVFEEWIDTKSPEQVEKIMDVIKSTIY